jgi:hypothetical protein
MTIALAIVGMAALVAWEVHAARRDAKFSATPVVIVKAPGARWWRRLAEQAVKAAIVVAVFAAALVLVRRSANPGTDPEHSWPMPSTTPASSHTPSHSATPGKGITR